MTKKEVLEQLKRAKSAHIQWRSYAQALIAGVQVKEDYAPIRHTDCKFGKWYYGIGQQLAPLPGYEAIEAPHDMLHQIYMRIYKLANTETEVGLLGKLTGQKSRIENKNRQEAEYLMDKLLSISATLLEAIDVLENDIKDMTEEEIAELF